MAQINNLLLLPEIIKLVFYTIIKSIFRVWIKMTPGEKICLKINDCLTSKTSAIASLVDYSY